ncbi:BMP family ABC transporter substrate-binding protein [Campylobacterota bacterium]|nr:BMP family ABC transporter substrate-binding protein [Campylobacterota bacterium]
MNKKIAVVIVVVIAACAAAFFGLTRYEAGETVASEPTALSLENIKIGVLYFTNPLTETGGYAVGHETGIKRMQSELGLRDDQILRKVNVLEFDDPGIEGAMRDLIAVGANIIFATSWGYMDSVERLAAEFPNVIFAHASGHKYNGTNFTYYFGRIYQARYLSGIAAGLKTQTNKVGYIAAMGKDNSEVTGGVNAFALGVARVNPDAKVFVSVLHSWYDPVQERFAAQTLISIGVDVLTQHCDTAYAMMEAEKAGVWGIGYNYDMSETAPNAVLTSVVWHWGAYYTHLVKSVIDGTFTTKPYFGGLAEGMVDITPLASFAAKGTAELIAQERRRMLDGSFKVFDGVIATNDGGTRRSVGSAGATLSDEQIHSGTDWYYQSIIEISR